MSFCLLLANADRVMSLIGLVVSVGGRVRMVRKYSNGSRRVGAADFDQV